MWNNNDWSLWHHNVLKFQTFNKWIEKCIIYQLLKLSCLHHIHQHHPLSIIDPNFLTLDSGASNKFAMGELSEFSFDRAGPGHPQKYKKYKKPLLIEESKSWISSVICRHSFSLNFVVKLGSRSSPGEF